MKIYKIKVNGKAYEVEVEAISESNGHIEAPKSAPVQASAPSGAGQELKAPMAGTILGVKVNVGDQVKKGDTVVVLEAMKLENEVKSQVEGKVISISVQKGSAVKNGDCLMIIG